MENHWHSVVDDGGRGIGSRGQNRARFKPVPGCVLPAVPQSREREQLSIIDLEAEWLLGCPRLLPFVETVCRNQTSAELERIAERGLRGSCLGFRVYRARSDGGVSCPMRDESPFHH